MDKSCVDVTKRLGYVQILCAWNVAFCQRLKVWKMSQSFGPRRLHTESCYGLRSGLWPTAVFPHAARITSSTTPAIRFRSWVACRGLVMPWATASLYAPSPNSSIVQWPIVVIVIVCTSFVTSQYDVIFTFVNQR